MEFIERQLLRTYRRSAFPVLLAATAGLLTAQGQPSAAQAVDPATIHPRDRVPARIDNATTVVLPGYVHPEARPDNDLGAVPGSLLMPDMVLSLSRSAEQQAALDAYSEALRTPGSPFYHQWLTAQTFGEHFGLSLNDLNRVAQWLRNEGFTVDDIPPGHWTIMFSGTAAQVEAAFHTPVHYYAARGGTHYANATDPRIPLDLSGIVSAISGLQSFPPEPAMAPASSPQGITGNGFFLSPQDFAAIYNVNPLYDSSIYGSGVRIAVIAPCVVADLSPVLAYRILETLPAATLTTQTFGSPASCTVDFTDEAFLDLELAGAVARKAQIYLVSSSSPFAAVQGVVSNALTQVVTMSYADCEGPQDQQWRDLWQQAHNEGITGLVSSGDTGAAGCDAHTATTATHGAAVNGYCASQYVICVGGTQLNDVPNPGQYWSSAGRAQGYIPEVAWNETGAPGKTTLAVASGGGFSTLEPRPDFQTGNTTPHRGLPDVALSASTHDSYFVCNGDNPCNSSASFLSLDAGTSAATPAFAGIMAQVIEAAGRQGNPNPTLYSLAGQPSLGIFHDIVSGNNSVNGQAGFSASPGWDPVTGLGSVDAAALVTNWPGTAATTTPSFSTLEMSKTQAFGCTPSPPSNSSFMTTDGNAYFFFVWNVKAVATEPTIVVTKFLEPDGSIVQSGGDTHFELPGGYCSGTRLDLGRLTLSQLGQWQGLVYFNGVQVASVPFTVTSPVVPPGPAITAISPSSVATSSAAFTLSVTGANFQKGDFIYWNDSQLTTTFVSATRLTATVTPGLFASPGSAAVSVVTVGLASAPATMTITLALPTNAFRIGVFSHLAAGAGWDTAIYLTNTSASAVIAGLYFYGDNGTPLTLPVTATQQGNSTSQTTSALPAFIPANTTFALDTGALGATVGGWVDIRATGLVTGFAVFRYAPQGLTGAPGVATPWEGTVPLQTNLSPTLLTLPFDNTSGFATGLALGNLTAAAANYTATFYDDAGSALGSPQAINLPANGHTSFLVGSQYGFTANTRGIMKVSGPALMGLGLRASPYGTLTDIPAPLSTGDPPAPISSLLSHVGALSHLAAGGGWDTAIYLTNTSPSPVSVRISLQSDGGAPLSLPLIVTQQGKTQNVTTASLNAVIPANTTLSIDTASMASPAEGWADLFCTGSLNGFAVFRYAPQGLSRTSGAVTPWEGTVPLQTNLSPTTLTLPFDNANGFATGLALGNLTSSPANYTATFYNDNGDALGSPQAIALSPSGHTSFVVGSQFGFTVNARGIMKITGPALTGLGLRASPYGTLTAIPVPLN